jgi:hypothetical protein
MTGDAERLSVPGTEGLSLEAVIAASRRLDELSTARVIGEAAEAVHRAQKGGQPLGTLSPVAILVRASGAVALEPPAVGLVGYSAPERLRGSPGDRRSDVFSLGVLLWEALAHERLFEGASDDAVKAAVLAGELRPPSACNANIPAELDAICRKALARDPADRYQSAKVMAAEISAVLDNAGYPETNEQLARYVAETPPPAVPATIQMPALARLPAEPATLQMPALAPAPVMPATLPLPTIAPVPAEPATLPLPTAAPALAALVPPKATSVSQEWTAIGRATTLGVAPMRAPAPEPALLEKQVEAAPVLLDQKKDRSEPVAAARPSEGAPPAPSPSIATSPDARPKTPAAETPPSHRPKTPTPEPSPSSLPTLADARPGQGAPAVVVPQQMPVIPWPPDPPASGAPAPLVLGPIPGGTVGPSVPSKLGVLPPGAQTVILGSLGAAAEPGPVPASTPAPAPEAPSVVLASGSPDDAAKLASVQWHDPPAMPSLKPEISEAEPPQAPSLEAEPPRPAPAEHTALQAGSIPAVPEADSTASKSGPHAAAAAPRRARSRSHADPTGDMLGGWGWSADAVDALDDEYEDNSRASRKRLPIAIGGAAAALLLVMIVVFAAGGSKSKDEPPAPATQVSKAWDTPPPPEPAAAAAPAPAEPTATEPTATEPAKPEPTAAEKSEPAKPEPAKSEPAKPEPAKPEPLKLTTKPEPAKLTAKPELSKPATRPEPARVAVRPEPAKPAAKPEPAKPEPAKPKLEPREPKSFAALTVRKPDKPKTESSALMPVDPYAADAKKIDPNTAYKTGLQQFARGDSNGALATFKASLAANPGYAPTWRGIGLVYEKIGRKAQARTAFQKYLELAPTAGDADQIRERMGRLP